MRWTRYAVPLVMAAAMAACSDTAGLEDGGSIGIRFAGTTAPSAAASGTDAALGAGIDLPGTNGTLTLDDVRLIIREFELDLVDDRCGDDSEGSSGEGSSRDNDDDCEKFKAPPAFVNLPLEGDGAKIVEQQVPPGLYDELELEVKEVEDEPDDDDSRDQKMVDLLAAIRVQYPEWPRKASLRVEGTFTPVNGSPRAFTAYFEAEIEIEMEFNPPLLIGPDDSAIVTVEVDPSLWFRLSDNRVVDLSAHDYATTGRVSEFEIELEKGFTRTRFEH